MKAYHLQARLLQFTVGKNLGLYGTDNAITLIVDFKDRAGWDAFMTNSYHALLNYTASEVLVLSAATAAQIEF